MLKVKIGGPAGLGIMTSGLIFSKLLKRIGYHVHGYQEYPSLIRGGYNNYLIIADNNETSAPYKRYDILVALTDVALMNEKITDDMVVLVDLENTKEKALLRGKVVDLPFKKILTASGANEIAKNSIALGALVKLLNIDFGEFDKLLKENYPSEKLYKINYQTAKKGYSCVNESLSVKHSVKDSSNKLILTGNEAICLGAITAGVNFFATYPMTPASSILHFLAEQELQFNIITKHTEDEISAINMAIGASFAGARSMVATSGGGFSLMVEGLGLAAIAETPIVIVESQRPGPATGMPTWTEQADLKFVLNASQDEFVRVVLTPGDVEELFYFTFDAFNLAEKYQIPVFILSDKYLSESHFTTKSFKTDHLQIDRGLLFDGDPGKPMEFFPRYKEVENGIGMRTIPGTPGGLYKAPGNEHDEYGFVTDNAENRVIQQDRRFKKIPEIIKEIPHPALYGADDATITVVCWGSLKLQMMELLKYTNKVNFIHFPAIHPLDWSKVKALFENRNLVIVENNKTAQLRSVIAEQTGIIIEKTILKYDGRPFFVDELYEKLLGEVL
ncbi:2-oxoacid:acceptor oxidoreductase subunit alpha [Calditerrivibrio nitroreducens]|uniref:Pyruvate flavodoxin/ferredoxin oxidoreductase domain protein n=1 Tax=Calditerrivibrio nitroreducens (strain DSM 19672 / NBRC 101217 / Yu37-1) TaxID=768670 RepID=E4THE6_CALNY|nr:2-oxoacid:acceptor oxidoreductase subunit alpha [Calditerrivibrio nitroreducens]ADR19881.1 pyruvate flavodoxin/ferredoxin oxidoreductase domain protein [Calditerrivibrio nitroreducens DSM 19672]